MFNRLQKIFGNKSRQGKRLLEKINTLQFEVTNLCNLKCSICCRDLMEGKLKQKSVALEDFIKIFDKLSSFLNIKEFNPQGLGEPFLCPDLIPILSYVKSKKVTVWLVSNGTLLDDKASGEIVYAGVDKIRISVDTADPVLYAKIKQNSRLEDVIKNIQRLNFYKEKSGKDSPHLAFNSVVLKSNIDQLDELISMAAKLRVEEVTLIPMVVFSKGMSVQAEQVDFYKEDFKNKFTALKDSAKLKGVELNLGISMETKETKYCHRGIYVDAAGIIHPCCNISLFKLGNACRDDAGTIAANYLNFRKWLDRKNITCKECNCILDKN